MQLVFDPGKDNDLEQVAIPHGGRMLTLKRGAVATVNDAIGAGLLKSNPELYRLPSKAELAQADKPKPAAAPAAPEA